MMEVDGRFYFGCWRELPYDFDTGESFEEYTKLKNTISREGVIRHLEGLPVAAMANVGDRVDIFTGEPIEFGRCEDGEFVFPSEFLHYYKNYDIGIPYEFEAYLKSIGVK